MITVIRKHHKTLMIVITALVCISFSWYWNKTDFGQLGNGAVGRIYDHNVTQVEFDRNARLLRLASQLGMQNLVRELTTGAQNESEAFENFSWNLMVLRHEAKQLGIEPTTAEIAQAVKALPAFQSEKGFDLTAYSNFADHALAPMGFTEAQIEELAADQIALERVKKLLSAGVAIPETDMRQDFEQAYAKMDASVVRLQPEEFARDIQVSDDQIAKYFESHKAELTTDEKRQVRFVQFGLTEEQKKLKGKERIEVLQKLADRANDFTDALQAKGAEFDQVAAKFGIAPKETGEFAKAAPDPQLGAAPQLAQAAFALTKETPNSDAIQTSDGFEILHLVKVEPSRPLTQEEARPKIVEAITKEMTQQAIATKAAEIAGKLRADLESGKSIEQAATDAGVKAEKLKPFALLDSLPNASAAPTPAPKEEDPEMQRIKMTASSLQPGEVSDLVRLPKGGGLLVVLEKREKVDPAVYEKSRPILEERALTNKGDVVFYEWLRDRRHAAGVEEKARPQPVPG